MSTIRAPRGGLVRILLRQSANGTNAFWTRGHVRRGTRTTDLYDAQNKLFVSVPNDNVAAVEREST